MKPVLDGTVALVTGASSGIGAGTAAALAGQGAAVALAARRGDRLKALAAGIRGRGGAAVKRLVIQGADEGRWDYEEGCVTPEWLAIE